MKLFKTLAMVNWQSTLWGAVTGAALGFAAYSTGSPELYVAAAGAFTSGLVSKDATVEGVKG